MKLLALDTATEACSVALQVDGHLEARHEVPGRGHAERLLPMIDALLADAALRLADLDAIAFGCGPGGFTGVRLCASVVQGLAFGANLPVIPVSTLRAVAQSALQREPGAVAALVCNDARMGEVYWAAFVRGPGGLAAPLGGEQVGPPEAVQWHPALAPAAVPLADTVGAGRGFAVHPSLAARFAGARCLLAELLPEAASIAQLAVPEWLAGRALPAQSALPVYVRNDVARPAQGR